MQEPKRLLTPSLAAAVLTVAWLAPVPAANAQAPSPAPQAPAPQTSAPQSPTQQSPAPAPSEQSKTPSAESANIPDDKLDKAAAALEQVSSLKENYEAKIQAAPAADRDRITAEANNALEDAVTGQGLSVEEYTNIIVVAQNNPEVREKILQRIRPQTRGTGNGDTSSGSKK